MFLYILITVIRDSPLQINACNIILPYRNPRKGYRNRPDPVDGGLHIENRLPQCDLSTLRVQEEEFQGLAFAFQHILYHIVWSLWGRMQISLRCSLFP